MNWAQIIKTGGEVAKLIGDLLDDGKINNSNSKNNNQKS